MNLFKSQKRKTERSTKTANIINYGASRVKNEAQKRRENIINTVTVTQKMK